MNKNCTPGDRERLKIKTVDAETPVKLSSHISYYFDNCLGYAHSFVSETCDGTLRKYSAIFELAPNNSALVGKDVGDWRGWFHRKPGFTEQLSCF